MKQVWYIKKLNCREYWYDTWVTEDQWEESISDAKKFDSEQEVVEYLQYMKEAHEDSIPKMLTGTKIEICSYIEIQ